LVPEPDRDNRLVPVRGRAVQEEVDRLPVPDHERLLRVPRVTGRVDRGVPLLGVHVDVEAGRRRSPGDDDLVDLELGLRDRQYVRREADGPVALVRPGGVGRAGRGPRAEGEVGHQVVRTPLPPGGGVITDWVAVSEAATPGGGPWVMPGSGPPDWVVDGLITG